VMGNVVAAMPEPAPSISAAYRVERFGGGLHQGLAGAGFYPAQRMPFTFEKASSMGFMSGE
jgi:hypothetical protein